MLSQALEPLHPAPFFICAEQRLKNNYDAVLKGYREIPRFCRADILDSWYKPGGCHVEKFRLPSLVWACTPFPYDGSRYFLFTRNKIYLSRAKQGVTNISCMYYIPESRRNGKEKKGIHSRAGCKKLLISIDYRVLHVDNPKRAASSENIFSGKNSVKGKDCLFVIINLFGKIQKPFCSRIRRFLQSTELIAKSI